MANGSAKQFPLFIARNKWHKAGTHDGLGNRRSILLSYGALAVFLDFCGALVNRSAQNAQQATRNGGTRGGTWRSRFNPARQLALLSAAKRKRESLTAHEKMLATARQMRRDAGLPDDPRLVG